MNRDQASQLIEQTFTQPFDGDRFRTFALNLLNHVDEAKARRWNRQYVKDAFKEHVNRYERLGTYTSPDGEKLDVLIVHLTSESKLQRARTAIRNFVAHHLKTRDEKDAALVAFVSPAETQWRLSYVKMEYATVETRSGKVGVETRLTPARRFSYIVGEGESCHTAQTRFLGLLQNTEADPSLADLEDAFSVEAVTKEFFTKYAELFGRIHEALDELVAKDRIIRNEFEEKHVGTADFAKKLLGQIVFLYFLQKKGWLGVAKGKDWGTGPHDFLRRLARADYGEYTSFFNDILEPLFYDTLATDRGHDAWCDRFECRIPFLNGGLFEPLYDYDWRKTDVILPNRLFTNSEPVEEGITGTGVLDVFDRYNFTVNEAEPLEREVAIDPEMLGRVFENLIEENIRRGLGAYYTPREIVHYMCQESLISYLEISLGADMFAVARADLDAFVHMGDQAALYEAARVSGTKSYPMHLPRSIEQNAKFIDEKLAEITVCDPAVGSGAFPVGMMTEIVRARCALTPYFNDAHERSPYHFKCNAIRNSLYGVDMDAGAVEIARLRLWLSLVVDEEEVEQVKPLPNLDFKIVSGDSLLGFPFRPQRMDEIERLKARFFGETDHQSKADLKLRIDEELAKCFASSRRSLGYEVTFDFRIHFSEVFHTKGGFDVVIANPPYVSVEKFARTEVQAIWKREFKTYASRGDIYCFFYERGLALLHDGGVLTFISSNKFQRAGYGKSLRLLLNSQRIRTLIDFCELPVFAASTDPMIVQVEKGDVLPDREFPVLVVKNETEVYSLPSSVRTRASLYRSDQLDPDGWSLVGGHGLALVGKLRGAGIPLGDYVEGKIYCGIKTGLNGAFVIDRATRDRLIREDHSSAELIKPWIRGKDLRRWTHEFHELYVILVGYGFHTELKRYPAILRHLSAFEEKLRARGQCKTSRGGGEGGQHHWLELDNNPSEEYIKAFDEPKIFSNETSRELHACLDSEGNVINNTGFIILSADAQFILAILNSSVMDWFYRSTFPPLGDPWAGGRLRFRGSRMKGVPIPQARAADRLRLTKLAAQAAKCARAGDNAAMTDIEQRIDRIAYRLFGLTSDEVGQIERDLSQIGGAPRDNGDGSASD